MSAEHIICGNFFKFAGIKHRHLNTRCACCSLLKRYLCLRQTFLSAFTDVRSFGITRVRIIYLPDIQQSECGHNLSRRFSRYSASTIMKPHYKQFCFDKYDAIGFDLDGTLMRYNLTAMVELEYEVLRRFLVEQKQYPKALLEKKLDLDFLQKGLVLDTEKGNILKLNGEARIIQATHGSKLLTRDQIKEVYGPGLQWSVSTQFFKDPLSTWNGPLSEKMRTLLDYFDMAVSLVFAQAIDVIDAEAQAEKKILRSAPYKVWPDLLEGIVLMYQRDNFANGLSPYFNALRAEPGRYLLRVRPSVLQWIKDLRAAGKVLYLLTGSNIDFANFTASYTIGNDWQQYFDCVVCFAKKPGFFTQQRPFLRVMGTTELPESALSLDADLPLGATYTQGNWQQLKTALAKKIGKPLKSTNFLFLGDNLIQDVYTPVKHHDFDAVAFCEEMLAEQNSEHIAYEFKNVVGSKFWGSYFFKNNEATLWTCIISQYSQLCVPLIETVVQMPVTHKFLCENPEGYYPEAPKALLV